ERIKVAVFEPISPIVERRYCLRLVCFHGGNRLVEHCLCFLSSALRECGIGGEQWRRLPVYRPSTCEASFPPRLMCGHLMSDNSGRGKSEPRFLSNCAGRCLWMGHIGDTARPDGPKWVTPSPAAPRRIS